jgi:protein KTI12
MRYEEPNSMARWDSPLYTVPWSDESAPAQEIWETVTAGAKAPSNVAVLLVRDYIV